MSDYHNIPRTSLNKPIANQGFGDPNLANQNLGQQQHPGGISHPIGATENFIQKEEFLHGGQQFGQQLQPGQLPPGGQQHLVGQQYFGGQQLATGQVFQGSNAFSSGSYSQAIHHTVTQQTSMAAANLPSKIITIEEKPAIITTVTTSTAPIQVETQTRLLQETVQSTRQEAIVQPVIQPVVQMQEQVVGMEPVVGLVPVTTGFVETGTVQNAGMAGGSTVISSNTTSFPIGVTDTHSTQGFYSTTPLTSNNNQQINTGQGAPIVHEKKKHGFFHRKHKDKSGENKY